MQTLSREIPMIPFSILTTTYPPPPLLTSPLKICPLQKILHLTIQATWCIYNLILPQACPRITHGISRSQIAELQLHLLMQAIQCHCMTTECLRITKRLGKPSLRWTMISLWKSKIVHICACMPRTSDASKFHLHNLTITSYCLVFHRQSCGCIVLRGLDIPDEVPRCKLALVPHLPAPGLPYFPVDDTFTLSHDGVVAVLPTNIYFALKAEDYHEDIL